MLNTFIGLFTAGRILEATEGFTSIDRNHIHKSF